MCVSHVFSYAAAMILHNVQTDACLCSWLCALVCVGARLSASLSQHQQFAVCDSVYKCMSSGWKCMCVSGELQAIE